MGIDVKETCAIIWKVIGFSMSTSIKFMRNHPILSLVSMCLLALYILLPSLLFFLIYSSPVLACAVVYAREKLGLRFSGSSSGPESCEGENKGGRCHLRQQRSVRRNARMKVEEWDSQTSDEEKDKVILTSLYNDLLGRTPQFEESPKAIETNVVEEENDKAAFVKEDSRTSSLDLGYLNVEEEPMVCNCEVSEEKHHDDKEEMGNVNEHGISEVERNKRLESLIARRRTRRLFKLALDQHNKLQAEETTSPTQNNNLQITVPRNNNNNSFEKRRSYQSGLQVPGSAPSVMLQARSPFDIPYDPQEERPNLTGDSFDQEFSFFNPNDMLLSRHESFCRFAQFSPEHAQCMNSPVPASDISTTRKLLDLDNEYMDHNEQNIPYYKQVKREDDDKSGDEGVENKNGDVVNNEADSSEEDDDTSSCSEESEAELNRFNKAELREAINHSMDKFPGFLVNQARNDIPSPLPRGLVAPRLDDNNMFYARRGTSSHGRTFSIASDMQVEVSELGSPPTTVDWLDDWSNGGESYTYDTDIDREIIRGEESRKRVSQQCESRSKEDDNGLVTKPYQKCLSDEHLKTADEMSLLDRRSQTKENFELRPSRSSDVPKSRSYGKLDGLLFHTSVSLSSITEEPEAILDSVDVGNKITLTSRVSSMKNLIDEDVVDVQQLEHDDLCGPPKIMDSNIVDHQQKDQILSNNQGEHDTEIHMKEHENAKPKEYEAAQSVLDASLKAPCVESFEREIKEEEPNLDISSKEVTQQREDKALQGELTNSLKLLESEVMEEDGQELVKKSNENAKPIEQEKNHDVLDASLIHPCTQLSEEYSNAKNDTDVILLQVQDGNNSTLDESPDRQFSNEEESSELLKDLHVESAQECNNIVNVEEESIGLEEAPNSKGSQAWTQQQGTDSSQGTQEPKHDEAISQDVAKDLENETAKPKENEADRSVLDASLDTPCVGSFDGEMKEKEEEEEPKLDNFTKSITEQVEDNALQGDLTSSPCHVFTNLQESVVMEENDPILVKKYDMSPKLVEQEKTHEVLEASSRPPYTQLVDDCENAKNDCDMMLLKIQDGNDSTLDESTDQEFSMEGENSGLLKDLHAGPTQEYNNIVNVKEEFIVSEDMHDSQGSQPWTQQQGTNSSKGISPRTLEIAQKTEHDDAISQDIAEDKDATAAKHPTDTEKNDEENLKPGEQVTEEDEEKDLQLTLQPLHHNTGLTASEGDEESKKVVESVNNSEIKTTKTETDS
ncbi:LRR protein [Hirschfeldia incana]|nr:LRR protein [Hirschfeldia incana]